MYIFCSGHATQIYTNELHTVTIGTILIENCFELYNVTLNVPPQGTFTVLHISVIRSNGLS